MDAPTISRGKLTSYRVYLVCCDGCTEFLQFNETTSARADSFIKKIGWVYSWGSWRCAKCHEHHLTVVKDREKNEC